LGQLIVCLPENGSERLWRRQVPSSCHSSCSKRSVYRRSHRTVKWCLSQIYPDYDIWMEEGHESKGPLRDRRDHDFDCGLGLTVITMVHRRVFEDVKTSKIEWMQGSQQHTLGHMTPGQILILGLVTHSGESFR
jgi:hypothetical protein